MSYMEKTSRFISLILRHNPKAIGISIDKEGWADVSQLVKGVNASGRVLNFNDLKRIVEEDEKGRYEFDKNFRKIRAVQGHSIPEVIIEYEQKTPPDVLYHGTTGSNYNMIKKSGHICKMSRNYVHLSKDKETAKTVAGRRKGKKVILLIDSRKMIQDGYKFFLAPNKVWLVDDIPVEYISSVIEII